MSCEIKKSNSWHLGYRESRGVIEGSVLRQLHLEKKIIWCIWSDYCDEVVKSLPFPTLGTSLFSFKTICFNYKFCSTSIWKGRRWMAREWSEASSLYYCPFPSDFYKADTLWPKSNSCESPWNFLNLFHILPGIGSEGKKWNIRVGEHGAQSQRVTFSCPVCFLNTMLSDPWEYAFPHVPQYYGLPTLLHPFPQEEKKEEDKSLGKRWK